MPELPEVETIVRGLRTGLGPEKGLPGKLIRDGVLLWDRTLSTPTPAEFSERIGGQRVVELGRRGKFIRIYLDRDELIIHLRMSGDLILEEVGEPTRTHDRMWLHFSDGKRLAFVDARKFGRVWLTSDPQTVLGSLGPEPLDDSFTPEAFAEMLASRHRQLKPLLLDQTFIAGIGNIYADESLHRSRLHPLKNSNTLNLEQAYRLYHGIRASLEQGIQANGASIDWVYRGGDFQNYFRVYQRTGDPCPVCGHPIERIVVGQRGTHVCPVCQPLE